MSAGSAAGPRPEHDFGISTRPARGPSAALPAPPAEGLAQAAREVVRESGAGAGADAVDDADTKARTDAVADAGTEGIDDDDADADADADAGAGDGADAGLRWGAVAAASAATQVAPPTKRVHSVRSSACSGCLNPLRLWDLYQPGARQVFCLSHLPGMQLRVFPADLPASRLGTSLRVEVVLASRLGYHRLPGMQRRDYPADPQADRYGTGPLVEVLQAQAAREDSGGWCRC